MRPYCLYNSEAWLQVSCTDQPTAFNKTTTDLIIPQIKQEEKCLSLTTYSSSTPPVKLVYVQEHAQRFIFSATPITMKKNLPGLLFLPGMQSEEFE